MNRTIKVESATAHGNASPRGGHSLDPGKETPISRLSGQLAGSPQAEHRVGEIQRVKDEIYNAYAGAGHRYQHSGIMDYRFAAVADMGGMLAPAETVKSSALSSALSFGAKIAAAVLAGLAEEPVAATFIEIGDALQSAFVQTKDTESLSSPRMFVSHYDSVLRAHWHKALNKLLAKTDTVEEAHRTLGKIQKLLEHGDRIKKAQHDELLDAWVNALKVKSSGGSPAGVGDKDFRGDSPGQLHVRGIKLIVHDKTGGIEVALDEMGASLKNIGQDGANLMLNRTLEKIPVARTVSGYSVITYTGKGPPPPTSFGFGVRPDGEVIATENDASPVSDARIKNIGKGDYKAGVEAIWGLIKKTTLARLGVTNVGV